LPGQIKVFLRLIAEHGPLFGKSSLTCRQQSSQHFAVMFARFYLFANAIDLLIEMHHISFHLYCSSMCVFQLLQRVLIYLSPWHGNLADAAERRQR
jgi:hypothetical protein